MFWSWVCFIVWFVDSSAGSSVFSLLYTVAAGENHRGISIQGL